MELKGEKMFKIIDYKSAIKSVPEKEGFAFVHPFYRDTFAKLYNVDAQSLISANEDYPKESLNLLLPLLRDVSKGYEEKIRCFYDVRITEEFGYPAPEYLLLQGAELSKVSPLCVKGMKALSLPFALILAEHALQNGDYGVICCANLNTPFDNSKKYEAGALLLQKVNEGEVIDSQETLVISTYRHNLTKDDLIEYENKHRVAVIDAEEDDLGIVFTQLSTLTKDCIITWNTQGYYGFIHLRKGV